MKRLLIAIAVVLTTASVAGAQPGPVSPANAEKTAKAKAASAKAHFDRGDYAVAVEEYREAYRLVGSCSEAVDAYREYLRLVPDSPYRATAEQNLAAAEVCARDAEAAAKRREERAKAAAIAATASPPPAPVADRGHGMRRTGVGAMAVGGMLVVAGGYFAIDAARSASEVSDFYENGGAWADVADADERGRRSQLVARVAFAAGTVAIASGVTLYLLGRRAEHAPAVAVTPTGRGAEMVVSWRF